LKATYNNLLNAGDNLNLSKMELSIKNREYEASKIKYEIGVITNMELTDNLNKKLISEVDYEKAKLDYKLAKEKYEYEIKTGI
jgi:outer membrane protein TolC